MACGCQNKGAQFQVVTSDGKVVFGPTPYETTAKAMAQRHEGSTVEKVGE